MSAPETALDGNAENNERHGHQDEEVDHPDDDIGELLAEQIFESPVGVT